MEDIYKGLGQLFMKNLSTGDWFKANVDHTDFNTKPTEELPHSFTQEFECKGLKKFVDMFVRDTEAKLILNNTVSVILRMRQTLNMGKKRRVVLTIGADEYKMLNKASHLICNCNLKRYLKKVPVGKVRIKVIRDTRIESCQRVMAASMRNACGRRSS